MEKRFYLHIKWDETREKNCLKAGDRGVYDVEIKAGGEVKLICHLKKATVKKLSEDGLTLDIPDKGEYILRLNESATIRYSDGHQVAGDWVDERLTYEIKFSDMTLDEYEASLPEFDIQDGVLIKARSKKEVIIVPEGVVKIGHKAFCKSKMKEVVLPLTVEEISSFAFSECKNLKRVNLPEGLCKIGFYAFADTAIEDIDFPKSLWHIDTAAFKNTPFLKRVENDKFVIFDGRLLYLYNGYEDTVVIPDGVEVICPSAFTDRDTDESYYFKTPQKIILPNSVKRIDGSAFRYLYGLNDINLREDIDISPTAFNESGYKEQFEAFLATKGEQK